MELDIVYNEDCLQGLRKLPAECVDCCVTSPPYYALRDYGCDGQIGLEDTPQAYIDRLTEVFMEVHRVLKPTGTLWVNIGDSYCGTGDKGEWKDPKNVNGRNGQAVSKTKIVDGCKSKDLIGIQWMLAFSLRNAGWYLRQDIIWHKPNPMPESVTDRCTKAHEYIFLLSKSKQYYFDNAQIQEEATGYDGRKDTMMKGSTKYADAPIVPGQSVQSMAKRGHERWKFKEGEDGTATPVRNKRDVWSVNTKPDMNAHFAVYPEELIRPCILAGCPKGGVVLDPFMGSGTTARVARHWGRHYVGFELNPDYIDIIRKKSNVEVDMFAL